MEEKGVNFTITEESRVRVPEGACRFYLIIIPVCSAEEIKEKLSLLKEEYPDATHHVYAYRLLQGKEIKEKSSDDREPAGSAGKPVLEVLRRFCLVNTLAVAVRYFGGVKLGIGGLIRAYRRCTEEAVRACCTTPLEPELKFGVETPYQYLGEVMKLISQARGEIIEIDYHENALVYFKTSPDAAKDLEVTLRDITRGHGVLKEVN